jgi:hypothetical protein
MDFLENENVQHMDWPAMSPDLTPIENCSTNLIYASFLDIPNFFPRLYACPLELSPWQKGLHHGEIHS